MIGRQLLFTAVLGALVSGCTTSLETRPVPLSATRVDGLEYSLPALELEFAVTRRMVDCTPAADDGSTPLVPKFEVTVEPKQELVPAETFSMDYAKLSKAWKTSKLTVDWYDNRMLKSVNVSATDKSVDIALEALKTGISIAKLAGGIPAGAGQSGADIASCPAEVETRKKLLVQRKGAQGDLVDQTAIIEAFNARDAAKLSESEKQALGAAVKAAKEKTDAIADLDKKIAALDKVLAFTETVRWRPPSLAKAPVVEAHTFDFRILSSPQTLEEQARVKWIKGLFSITDVDDIGAGDPGCETVLGKDGEPRHFRCRLQIALALQVRLDPESIGAHADQVTRTETALSLTPSKPKKAQGRGDHVDGIVTRMPARARFLACSGGAFPCSRSSATKLVDQLVSVPQFGHYLVLPFSNGIGEDNTLTVSFAENGMPTSVTYEDKQAAGLAIAKGASQGAEAVLGFADDLRAARKASPAYS